MRHYLSMENLAKRKEQPIKDIVIDVIRFRGPVMGKVRSL
jgi:hypothetical protein